MRHYLAVGLIVCVFACRAVSAVAVRFQTATIDGQVRDISGAVVQVVNLHLTNGSIELTNEHQAQTLKLLRENSMIHFIIGKLAQVKIGSPTALAVVALWVVLTFIAVMTTVLTTGK